MLTLNLTPVFKARGIDKPYTFLVKAGFSAHTANNLANNKVMELSLKHIETLCLALFCEPNDLFLFTPDKKHGLADDHPMQRFTNQETPQKNYQDILSTMPFKQLKEITKALAEKTGM